MKVIGKNWIIHYPAGTTVLGDPQSEMDNFTIASEIVSAVEDITDAILPPEIECRIDLLNGNSNHANWRIEPLLPAQPESRISVGAHLVTWRLCYTHHGIYVGSERVVHYAGL